MVGAIHTLASSYVIACRPYIASCLLLEYPHFNQYSCQQWGHLHAGLRAALLLSLLYGMSPHLAAVLHQGASQHSQKDLLRLDSMKKLLKAEVASLKREVASQKACLHTLAKQIHKVGQGVLEKWLHDP